MTLDTTTRLDRDQFGAPGLAPLYEGAASDRFHAYTRRSLEQIPQWSCLPLSLRHEIQVASVVFPFRVNNYVLDHLIDWSRPREDPMFRLVFPQAQMLRPAEFARIADLLPDGADHPRLQALARSIRAKLNPHPANQRDMNVPRDEAGAIEGVQHKYRETVLLFPPAAQTCHAHCTFCFRWPQFVGEPELRFAATDYHRIHNYVARHTSITDLLVTGGDAFAPTARRLSAELLPLIEKRFAHISTFRFGTKVLAFWPHRFMNDRDSDELLRLIERLVSAGKNVAVMAHFNHPRELEGEPVREAVRRLRSAGAVIRTQGPVLRGINDAATTWQEMWTTQTALGMAPYYMFVARDTGPRHYFEVPLARTWQIYRDAIAQVSGIARTARGPVMSAGPGKVELTGVADVGREKAFVLRFLQARDPAWCHRPFFAKFDSRATWLSNLRPALNDTAFFFEAPYLKMIKSSTTAGTILERPYPATRENPAP